MKYNKANIETIGDGKAIQAVNYELERVIENCKDPNTEATGVRTVTLKIKVKPSQDRQRADVSIQATSQLAPDAPSTDQMVLARDGAYVANAKQLTLDDYDEKVSEIDDAKEGTDD